MMICVHVFSSFGWSPQLTGTIKVNIPVSRSRISGNVTWFSCRNCPHPLPGGCAVGKSGCIALINACINFLPFPSLLHAYSFLHSLHPFLQLSLHYYFVSSQFEIKWVKIVSEEWRIRCADTVFSAERLGEQLWRYPFPYGSSCWMEHSQQPSPMGLSCLGSNLYNPLWEEWYVFLENIPFPFPSRRHTVRRWLNAATGGRKTNRKELKGPRIGHKLFSFSPPWTLLQPAHAQHLPSGWGFGVKSRSQLCSIVLGDDAGSSLQKNLQEHGWMREWRAGRGTNTLVLWGIVLEMASWSFKKA